MPISGGTMGHFRKAFAPLLLTLVTVLSPGGSPAQTQPLVLLDQGWEASDRTAFYTTGQGSRLMPYAWFKALERADSPGLFLADGLARYGYLPNPRDKTSNPEGLPIGFVIDGNVTTGAIGMTCAACHTGQIEFGGTAIRVDGAPTNADFHKFLSELTAALKRTAAEPARFTAFAKRMTNPPQQAKFQSDVTRFAAYMDASLPLESWGPARLDAFGMIFNRLTGYDLNIPTNIKRADAPVSYPFLWGAHHQDKVQWNGIAPNGTYVTALGRNLGEVLGVFGDLSIGEPRLSISRSPTFTTSANFAGLQRLEEAVAKLEPPPWPEQHLGKIDWAKAARGKLLYDELCKGCHDTRRLTVMDVGTDPRMARRAGRKVSIAGTPLVGTAQPPLTGPPLAEEAAAAEVLANVVVGTILQQLQPPWDGNTRAVLRALVLDAQDPGQTLSVTGPRVLEAKKKLLKSLPRLYRAEPLGDENAPAAYEARPLNGIWATAPYLHNGSVPSLWDLLQPPGDRPASFPVGGRRFDPRTVGIDRSAPGTGEFKVGAFGDGDSNLGHDYNKRAADKPPLTPDDRWDLVEFLKTL